MLAPGPAPGGASIHSNRPDPSFRARPGERADQRTGRAAALRAGVAAGLAHQAFAALDQVTTLADLVFATAHAALTALH